MKAVWSVLGLSFSLALAAGCQKEQPSAAKTTEVEKPAGPRVELAIGRGSEDWGKIVLELNEAKAPKTVRNFVRYVEEGYYDGTIFHRVVSDFMVQGGGSTAIGQEKRAGQHEAIANESLNGLRNIPGTIAMARMDDPHSATSEFFINVADNRQALDAQPGRWGYAVFGKVVEGMDVVDRIRKVETRMNPGGVDRTPSQPVDPPVLRKARVIK